MIQGHQFPTNPEPICDFLLVINTNLHTILYYFQIIADRPIGHIFALDGVQFALTHLLG